MRDPCQGGKEIRRRERAGCGGGCEPYSAQASEDPLRRRNGAASVSAVDTRPACTRRSKEPRPRSSGDSRQKHLVPTPCRSPPQAARPAPVDFSCRCPQTKRETNEEKREASEVSQKAQEADARRSLSSSPLGANISASSGRSLKHCENSGA
mmetsp:Transcript_132775/g.383873  ORF Transcript_132775/g.383873 Transcript_132775/m.383873 type:complete len:152 (+) Transcript_132775:77-532(+)